MKQKLFLLTSYSFVSFHPVISFLSKPFVILYPQSILQRGTIKATLEHQLRFFKKKGNQLQQLIIFINGSQICRKIKMADAIFQSYSDKSTALLGPGGLY